MAEDNRVQLTHRLPAGCWVQTWRPERSATAAALTLTAVALGSLSLRLRVAGRGNWMRDNTRSTAEGGAGGAP